MAPTITHIGRYQVESELGRGGMGVVYKAFDPIFERTVAVKTIRLDVANPQELVDRLKREVKSVGRLAHPNIVTPYDAGEAEGHFYLAMEFIHGENLQDRINHQRWFSLKDIHELFSQISAGLDYAHQHHVVHRDIKPANIMITEEGIVKLADFGIAKLTDANTASGLIVGTPSYMSPEQALGMPLDGRSDIFSLGSILYELITGEKAFPGQNATTVIYKIVHEPPTPVTALQPGQDPGLEAVVLRALAKNREQRYQTCTELTKALEAHIHKVVEAIPKTSVVNVPVIPKTPDLPPHQESSPVEAKIEVKKSVVTPKVTDDAAERLQRPSAPSFSLPWMISGALTALLVVAAVFLVLHFRRPALTPGPSSSGAAESVPPSLGAGSTRKLPEPSDTKTSATEQSEPQQPVGGTRSKSVTAGAVTKTGQSQTRPVRAQTGRVSPLQTLVQTQAQKTSPEPEPPTFESLIIKGDLAFQDSKYQDALNAYSEAYRLNPRSADVRRKIAVVLTLLGRPEEAQKYQ